MTKKIRAYAKINLLLSIGSLRSDGKHDVVTVMNEVRGAYDDIAVTLTDKNIILTCSDAAVPCDGRNLAYKAAKLYFDEFGLDLGAKIHIEKHIPVTGGMGGGSTDAAAVLNALRELCGLGTAEDLCRIAAKLGSDVPFFIYRERTMLCCGTGELAASCSSFPLGLYGVFITEGSKESTGRAYTILDEKYPPSKRISDNSELDKRMVSSLENGDISETFAYMKNDFENSSPHFEKIAHDLYSIGAKKVILCGSGPTVCGIFFTEAEARAAFERLGYRGFVSEI